MAKVKILKSGETDIDSTDIWRFIFHSDYTTFKIQSGGNQQFTIPAGQSYGEFTITHSLGYRPVYFANIKYGNYSFQVASAIAPFYNGDYIYLENESGYDSIIYFYSYVENNTLVIGASTLDGENLQNTATFTGYYIINLDEF